MACRSSLLCLVVLASLGSCYGHFKDPYTPSPKHTFRPSYERCEQNYETRQAFCQQRRLLTIPDNLSPKIVEIYISFNRIDTLRNSSFQPYISLRKIDLSANDIRTIEVGTFHHLKHLTTLYLFWNYNIDINGDIFRYNNKLVTLHLWSCDLTNFPGSAFKWLTSLRELLLSDNKIKPH